MERERKRLTERERDCTCDVVECVGGCFEYKCALQVCVCVLGGAGDCVWMCVWEIEPHLMFYFGLQPSLHMTTIGSIYLELTA